MSGRRLVRALVAVLARWLGLRSSAATVDETPPQQLPIALAVLYGEGACPDPDVAPGSFSCLQGLAFANGWGVAHDDVTALAWLRHGTAEGDAPAQLELARMLDAERGVPPRPVSWVFTVPLALSPREVVQIDGADPELPAHHLRNAADQGHAQAQFELGSRYAGFAEASDYDAPHDAARYREMGFERYLGAAAQGHAEAQFRVARYLSREDRDEEAADYCRQAAAQGHVRAQLWLGDMHAAGQGVTRDEGAALH